MLSRSTPATLPSRLLVALLVLAPLALAGAAIAQPPARKPIDLTAPAETQYQNVQVLKGMTAGELHDAMDYIEGALGVGCGHCHVRPFEKDDKPEKEIAREMIRMVAAINRDNFDGRMVVTCATCHQGRPKPLAFAVPGPAPVSPQAFVRDEAPPDEHAPPGERAGAAWLPPAGPVVERFVRALGGRTALAALPGLRMTATRGGG